MLLDKFSTCTHEDIISTDTLKTAANFTSFTPLQFITTKRKQHTVKANKGWGYQLVTTEKNTTHTYFQIIHGIKLAEDSRGRWMDLQDKYKDMEAI